jgi:hypothetical protein
MHRAGQMCNVGSVRLLNSNRQKSREGPEIFSFSIARPKTRWSDRDNFPPTRAQQSYMNRVWDDRISFQNFGCLQELKDNPVFQAAWGKRTIAAIDEVMEGAAWQKPISPGAHFICGTARRRHIDCHRFPSPRAQMVQGPSTLARRARC